jgi:hypothetical protein
MANEQRATQVTTPVGRIVMGNLYEPRTTDQENRPLVYKTGAKAGQPRKDYFFAVAIPKGAEATGPYGALNWAQTPWGAEIWKAGHAFLAHAGQLPAGQFSWKVLDGDSTVPNKAGTVLSQREGCKGCWVLTFGGTLAPRLCNADGSQQLSEPGAIKPGYYVQVCFTAEGNGATQQPGVYLNAQAVALAGYGPEISYGINTAAVGFGKGVQLPPGASTTPVGGMPAAGVPPLPAASAPPLPPGNVQTPPPLPAVPAAAMPGMPPVGAAAALPALQPNAAFLTPQPAPLQLLGQAAQYTLDQLKGMGYTEEILLAQGLAKR